MNVCFGFLLTLLVLGAYYIWKNWRFYCYTLQFPGSILVIASKLLPTLREDLQKVILEFCESHPPVFKIWLPNYLFVVNSQPEDVEVLLGNFLDKGFSYKIWDDISTSLVTSPANIWKGLRKEMNQSFNSKIIASFHDTFVKHARKIVQILEETCGEEQTDLFPEIFRCNLDSSFENIADMDPGLVENRYTGIECIIRAEELVTIRVKKFWLLSNFIFRFTDLYKEITKLSAQVQEVGTKVLTLKKEELGNVFKDSVKRKRFVNNMIETYSTGDKITTRELVDEIGFMLLASSETSSNTDIFVILLLGLYPEIQDKLYQEVNSLFKNLDDDLCSKDVDRLNYLECVIKETLRLFPAVPMIVRYIDKDFKQGSFTYPAGCNLVVPIEYLHRRPDLWPDPLKFEPDRFLAEEVAKRHRNAYIPFSCGPRNCIGFKYAMMSMKITLAYVVKHFKIKTLNCRSVEDLKSEWHVVVTPTKYCVMFEPRAKI